jgi:hypothetical protein
MMTELRKDLFLLEQSVLKVSVKREAQLLPLMLGLVRMLELAMLELELEMVVAEMVVVEMVVVEMVVVEMAGGVPQGLLGLGTEKGLAE